MPRERFWCEFLLVSSVISITAVDNIVCPQLTFFWVFWASGGAETVNSSMLNCAFMLQRRMSSCDQSKAVIWASGILPLPDQVWAASHPPLIGITAEILCEPELGLALQWFFSLPSAPFLLLMYCTGILVAGTCDQSAGNAAGLCFSCFMQVLPAPAASCVVIVFQSLHGYAHF